jgi:DNA-binding MarR family transcriptional regulator
LSIGRCSTYDGTVQTTRGARLALLLLENFERMVDEVSEGLARRGHPGVTATLEFALRAIDADADDVSSLARRLGVTRQAAAKSIAALEQLGYVERVDDPKDARRKQLRTTERGYEMDALGGQLFDELFDRWRTMLGPEDLEILEQALLKLNGGEPRAAR